MDNKQKPKFLLSGERDIDEVPPVIEFSNMKNDDRAICVKTCKEIMSKIIH